jgi:hypothetical protein
MDCPKCGAVNPEGAEHCNLCFHSFVEPKQRETANPETGNQEIDVKQESNPNEPVTLGTSVIPREVASGAAAALGGGLLFLAGLCLLSLLGINVFRFASNGLTIDTTGLAFTLLLACIFGVMSGGIAGNIKDKHNAAPVLRLMGALIAIAVWFGIVFAIKPSDLTYMSWLTVGIAGRAAALLVFPMIMTAIGISDSLDHEMDIKKTVYSAIGGLAAGMITAVMSISIFAALPVFGTMLPNGFIEVFVFGAKMVVLVSAVSLLSGTAMWILIPFALGRAVD